MDKAASRIRLLKMEVTVTATHGFSLWRSSLMLDYKPFRGEKGGRVVTNHRVTVKKK